jgi:hypothetical protein
MVCGVASLLPDRFGSFLAKGAREEWAAILEGWREAHHGSACKLGSHRFARVDVLVSRRTASSGEALAIALSANASARRVGENTAGLATGNERRKLADGTVFYLAAATMLDHRSNAFPAGLPPERELALPDPGPMPIADVERLLDALDETP